MNKHYLILFILTTFTFSSCSIREYWNKAILGNFPIIKNFIQKDFNTYTSITSIKNEMKLVTAKQQIDFINIMDGKSGQYLEISTFEVKAGLDCSKINYTKEKTNYPSIEIFSSNKICSVIPRKSADKNEQQFYENSIKPVNIAYEQKARDYAVELGLLQNAKKGAERTIKNLTDATINLDIDEYKKSFEIKYLPFTLDIEKNYFDRNNMKIVPIKEDQFYRDSFILESISNDKWSIRIGDTGRSFSGTFEDFYQNVFRTNSSENNLRNDRIEIFRYFDPMYPKECEILGYASDSYRTMFLLNNGRIYYIDAVANSEQTLINDLSSTIIYLASSLRKITNYKVDKLDEYHNYILNYFDIQESIRTNSSRTAVKNNVERLIKSNVIRDKETEISADEKYFSAVADVKCLGRTEKQVSVTETGDYDFDNLTNLTKDLLVSSDNFNSDETRDNAINIATRLDTSIYREKNRKAANTQYLEAWFLQNKIRFKLSPEVRKKYEDDINSGETYIASRPTIANLDDAQRNEYFYSLFKNRLTMSHFFIDTAESIDDEIKKSIRDTNMFVYYNIPEFEEVSDGDIYEQLKKQNSNRDIYNSFILIFAQQEWSWGNFGNDNDIHAIILDDSTFRFFPNVHCQNFIEKASYNLKTIFGTNKIPEYFFYGDWKKLRITPENVTINGNSFYTKKITKKGKAEYRNTNDYAEKSAIASVIDDLQHAYSNNDVDYYYNTLCNNLEYQIQRYVYDKIFRPSPRMILDNRVDEQRRYNY